MVGGLLRIGEAANPGPEERPKPVRDPPERGWKKQRESDQRFRVDSVNITAWGAKPKPQEDREGPVGRGSLAILYAEAPPIQMIQEHRLISEEDFRWAEGGRQGGGLPAARPEGHEDGP